MEKTLYLTFYNQEGHRQSITVPAPREDLTANEVEAAMNLIIQQNVFAGSGGDLVAAVEAQIVGRTVEVIYTA